MFPLSEGKIVVRVIRCDIAVPDILKPYQLAHEPPFVPGSRVCASVTKVDDAVTGIQVGDKVFCHLLDGGLTNEFVLSAEDVYKYSPGINADDSTENTVVSQVGFDDQSESRQGIKRPRGLEVNAMEEQPTAEHWMVAGLLWERERKEYVEEMVNALVTEDQKSKQKIAAFYDECRKAMYHDLISSKTFGEVDMLAICAAYEKKYGVVLDERAKRRMKNNCNMKDLKDRLSKDAYQSCKCLQEELCGSGGEPGRLWSWRAKTRYIEDGNWETYYDKADEVYTSIADEWGDALAEAVYAERLLCDKHGMEYPRTLPWNHEKNCELFPAEIMRIMTDKIVSRKNRKNFW